MAARLSEATWGVWPAFRIEGGSLSAVVVPAVGGRVVSLRDRRDGREWLTQGAPPDLDGAASWGREDAIFSGRESFGWDECLPTVAPCADPLEPGAPPLRDHGDQWGRPTRTTLEPAAGALTTTWAGSRWPYQLERRLSVEAGSALRVDYALTSFAEVPLPILWSMHPALALEPGSVVELPGVQQMRLAWARGLPIVAGDSVSWPTATAPDASNIDLGRVRPADGSAAKLYALAPLVARVVASDGAALELTWDPLIPALGLWLSFGGWPPDGPPVEQVALEPTSSPDDHLADALAHDRAWVVSARGSLRWWVRISCRPAAGESTR